MPGRGNALRLQWASWEERTKAGAQGRLLQRCRAHDQSCLQECFYATHPSCRATVTLHPLPRAVSGLPWAFVTASTNRAKGCMTSKATCSLSLHCWNIHSWYLELPWGHHTVRKPKLSPMERPDGQALRVSRAGEKERRGGRRRSGEREPQLTSPQLLESLTVPAPTTIWLEPHLRSLEPNSSPTETQGHLHHQLWWYQLTWYQVRATSINVTGGAHPRIPSL